MAETLVNARCSVPQLPPVTDVSIATKFQLAQNYPNPFNGTTTIEFWISQPAQVRLSVYDITGREVTNFVNGELSAGTRAYQFDGSQLSSGLYFYRLVVDGKAETKKILLIK